MAWTNTEKGWMAICVMHGTTWAAQCNDCARMKKWNEDNGVIVEQSEGPTGIPLSNDPNDTTPRQP